MEANHLCSCLWRRRFGTENSEPYPPTPVRVTLSPAVRWNVDTPRVRMLSILTWPRPAQSTRSSNLSHKHVIYSRPKNVETSSMQLDMVQLKCSRFYLQLLSADTRECLRQSLSFLVVSIA